MGMISKSNSGKKGRECRINYSPLAEVRDRYMSDGSAAAIASSLLHDMTFICLKYQVKKENTEESKSCLST